MNPHALITFIVCIGGFLWLVTSSTIVVLCKPQLPKLWWYKNWLLIVQVLCAFILLLMGLQKASQDVGFKEDKPQYEQINEPLYRLKQ